MRVRAVPKDRLPEIAGECWIDPAKSRMLTETRHGFPVRDNVPCEREIPRRARYHGKGFFMVGDIAVIHGKRPGKKEIDEIVGFRHPRGVLWIESLSDVTRTHGQSSFGGMPGKCNIGKRVHVHS